MCTSVCVRVCVSACVCVRVRVRALCARACVRARVRARVRALVSECVRVFDPSEGICVFGKSVCQVGLNIRNIRAGELLPP